MARRGAVGMAARRTKRAAWRAVAFRRQLAPGGELLMLRGWEFFWTVEKHAACEFQIFFLKAGLLDAFDPVRIRKQVTQYEIPFRLLSGTTVGVLLESTACRISSGSCVGGEFLLRFKWRHGAGIEGPVASNLRQSAFQTWKFELSCRETWLHAMRRMMEEIGTGITQNCYDLEAGNQRARLFESRISEHWTFYPWIFPVWELPCWNTPNLWTTNQPVNITGWTVTAREKPWCHPTLQTTGGSSWGIK